MKSTAISTKIPTSKFGRLHIKAQSFAPDQPLPHAILICLSGGSASRAYFDLGTIGGFDYSFASRMTEMGYHVIAIDHIGIGDNPLPKNAPFLMPRTAAKILRAAITEFTAPYPGLPVIGVGHSMGGMMSVLVNAVQPLSALALFGASSGGLAMALDDYEKTYMDHQDAFTKNLKALTLRKFKSEFAPSRGGPSGRSIVFGGENPQITARLREISCPLYSAGGLTSMTRGSFLSEAQTTKIPMFFAFGEHDIGIVPGDASKDFSNAPSKELLVLENTGHNSFAFASITTLCTRLNQWIKTLL